MVFYGKSCGVFSMHGFKGGGGGSKMKGTLNTIHYDPLQAISISTILLSETVLFIDAKISKKELDKAKREKTKNKINDAASQSSQTGKQRSSTNRVILSVCN